MIKIRDGEVAEKDRPKASAGGGRKGPPAAAEVGSSGGGTMSILVTGVPVEWASGLERARASGGHRSRNALILALLRAALS